MLFPQEESQEKYTFICKLSGNFTLYLHISPLDMYSSIVLETEERRIPLVEFKFCKRIRVIDIKKKWFEIIAGSPESLNVRCELNLIENDGWINIETNYEYYPPDS